MLFSVFDFSLLSLFANAQCDQETAQYFGRNETGRDRFGTKPIREESDAFISKQI
jgi:hypothetical protein